MHPINDLLEISLESLQKMIEANTIIGTPLEYNNCVILPISSLKLGFVSGGADIKDTNKDEPLFGGGTSGGVSINPVGFLVINNSEVSLLAFNSDTNLVDSILCKMPDACKKMIELFKNNAPIKEI